VDVRSTSKEDHGELLPHQQQPLRERNKRSNTMATSFRHVHRGVHGRVPANFNLPGVITSNQAVVHITAGEIVFAAASSVVNGVTQTFKYHVGDAEIWVTNVSPHCNDNFEGEQGGVGYILHVNFDSPLDVAVTITVEDTTPVGIN